MYHKINIKKLSPNQISKLLNGHRIRVKHGEGHEIHASEEQHKKIMRAHHKKASSTIQFDPFQQHEHQHLRHGHGGGSLGSMLKSGFKALAPVVIDEISHLAKNKVSGLGLKKHHAHHAHAHHEHEHHAHHAHHVHAGALMPAGYGEGIKRKRGRPSKKAGCGFFGNLAKSGLKVAGPMIIDELAHLAKNKIGSGRGKGKAHARKSGHGISATGRKRGRPSKKGHGIGNDILSGVEKFAPLALSFL